MKRFYILNAVLILCVITSYSQPGSLDLTFGPGGKVFTNIKLTNQSRDIITAMAIQTDGKVVVAGTSRSPEMPASLSPSIIMRYNADGTPDNSFNYNGMVLSYGIKFTGVAIQGDGKIVGAGTNFSLIRLNANGSIDNNFGNNGTASLPLGNGATSMVMQADGKFLMAGTFSDASGKQFVIVRFNSDGTPDNGFDGDGFVITDFGSSDEEIRNIALQADGKIVAVGYSGYSDLWGSRSVALARYNTDGTLDNSFDGNGMLTASFGTTNDLGSSVAIQTDGKIVISGFADNNAALARFTSSGVLDNSFDGDGKLVTTTLLLQSQVFPVALQNDGKIITAATLSNDYGLCRYNSDGSPDNSFSGDGTATIDVAGSLDRPFCLAVQSNGRIFVAGYSLNSGEDFSIACFQQDGSPDNSFHGDGKVRNVWYASFDVPYAMVVQNDGKIVLAGDTGSECCGVTNSFALARYNTDGTLDDTFDGDGRLSFTIGIDETFYALAVQPDGKILAAGRGEYQLSSRYDVSVVRLNPDGTRDNTFDGDGLAYVVPTSENDIVNSIAVQNDGRILIAGPNWVFRLNTNGSLDNSFDGDGSINTLIGGSAFLAVQNDGKILVAGVNNSDFAIARYLSTGGIDNSFDGDGITTTDFGTTSEWISSIKIQSDGKIVAGGISGNSFALARYNSDGTPDNSFDGDGKQTTDMNGTAGTGVKGYSLDIQSNGKIVMSGQTRNTTDDFILARYNTDGSLDNSFDGDGKVILDFGPGSDDHTAGMAIASNRIYMAGWITTPGAYDFMLAAVVAEPLAGPLPLQLRDFSGRRVNNDGQLNWKTELESNMLEYIVERSIDGRNYSDVGVVAAANRTAVHNYYFTDYNITSLNAPVVYYRLRQKSIDSKYSYSRIIALAMDKDRNIVIFYPNPVINEANVALTVSRPDKLQVRILDNVGRTVRQQPWNVSAGSTSLSIDVRNLASGMYYLEIKGESIDYKKQFIK